MVRGLAVLFGMWTLLAAASVNAQQTVLGQLYGSGVHSYFTGNYLKAHEQLTSAIDSGTRDPRAYYFRGLVYLKLGRPPEARMDFQKGAELETKDINNRFNVARALERVQGVARRNLETYRVEARKASLEEAKRLRKARFEALQREEQRVLLSQAAAAKLSAEQSAPKDMDEKKTGAGELIDTEDIFSTSEQEAQPPAGASMEKAPPDHEDDPFGGGVVEKQQTEEKDPFDSTFDENDSAVEKSVDKKGVFRALINAVGKAIHKELGVEGGEKVPPNPFEDEGAVNPFGPDRPPESSKAPDDEDPFAPPEAKPPEKSSPENPFE